MGFILKKLEFFHFTIVSIGLAHFSFCVSTLLFKYLYIVSFREGYTCLGTNRHLRLLEKMVPRIFIKSCCKSRMNRSSVLEMLNATFGESAMSKVRVYDW